MSLQIPTRFTWMILAIAALLQASLSAEDQPRSRTLIDFDWKFLQSDAPQAEASSFDDSAWAKVDLPHDWSIYGPFDRQAPSQRYGAFLPTGIGWYRKTINVPASEKGRQLSLEFDGVYEYSQVWINGNLLGARPYGFISFGYDVTPYLNFGGDNVIAVRVDNSRQTNCRWYSGSGIYRDVWLVNTDALHVQRWGTVITTPSITDASATVKVSADVRNDGSNPVSFEYVCTVLDAEGKSVQSARGSAQTPGASDGTFQTELALPSPKMWSVESPNLYTLRVELSRDGKTIDRYDTPFGVRDVRFDVDNGFFMNGQHVKLKGVCVHGDGGAVGTAVPIGVWKRRLAELKEMGCNAIRCSHNPPDPAFLDLCDQMGFCVMDEPFDEWAVAKQQVQNGYHTLFAEWHDRDATDFLKRDRNHPSIVIWSAGNEIPDQTASGGTQTVRELVDLFHKMDPTRQVTAACDNAYAEPQRAFPEFLAALDIVGYNYVDRWSTRSYLQYSVDRHDYPQRKMIGTENSSMGGPRGNYGDPFVRTTLPDTQPATRPAGGQGYGRGFAPRVSVEELWKFDDEHDYVAGDFMWTGIDYLGESGVGSSAGVIDTAGFKKDGFYFYQSRWTDTPMVHALPHWSWKGHEGQVLPVYCYTNCDSVELLVNGKSYGTKGFAFKQEGFRGGWGNSPLQGRLRTTSDLHLAWDVMYEPGTLKLIGRKSGQIVAIDEQHTAGDPAKILVEADQTSLIANGRDIANIAVKVVDSAGNVNPSADTDLTFDVKGEGKLIGVDNGSLSIDEAYKTNKRRAHHGLALGIVQATRQAGAITVTVHAAGLEDAVVELQGH